MNPPELIQLAKKLELDSDDRFALRVEFGIACIERVEHLLIDNEMLETLSIGKAYVQSESNEATLSKAANKASELASSHPGTNSLDGSGSAAVTTSYGVAAALAGRALQAAEYAAYASVYSYASHAVTDPSAYASEHSWQVRKLSLLAEHVDH